ncbi:hypothetical protein [Brevibacillus choshinensis]|nr:hypothetical protein [Brevibacillus choshinensis]MED4750651.1 hypothetical protein [Brevibacillus choshinensis]MED4779750.1 hypothetical protein [Brevibacillus choshinensis]
MTAHVYVGTVCKTASKNAMHDAFLHNEKADPLYKEWYVGDGIVLA